MTKRTTKQATKETRLLLSRASTPAGTVLFATREHGSALVALSFESFWPRQVLGLMRRFGAVAFVETTAVPDVSDALAAYAAGDVRALDALRTDAGGTAFQERAWEELRGIPAGTTISYAELASRVGNAKAVRAVASANARNPIPIVVPCHRVIASDGRLQGYAGGMERKEKLLRHEGVFFDDRGFVAAGAPGERPGVLPFASPHGGTKTSFGRAFLGMSASRVVAR